MSVPAMAVSAAVVMAVSVTIVMAMFLMLFIVLDRSFLFDVDPAFLFHIVGASRVDPDIHTRWRRQIAVDADIHSRGSGKARRHRKTGPGLIYSKSDDNCGHGKQ